MTDIDALIKRCQVGVPRGPNAYDDLHSILAECYGTLGSLRDQLHLAEVARAAQVEGVVQAAAGWRERANQLEAQVSALTAERDAALQASKWESDLCGQALEDLKSMTADRDGMREDALRYRWMALQRVTPEHWGGRWSIVIDGPAPQAWPYKDQFDAAIDAAREQGEPHDQLQPASARGVCSA